LPSHKAAKRLWKITVEHHTFFRLAAPELPPKENFFLPRFSSRFRYSGRTQSEIKRNAQPIDRIPPPFSRSLSNKRYSLRSIDNDLGVIKKYENEKLRTSMSVNSPNSLKSPVESSLHMNGQKKDLEEPIPQQRTSTMKKLDKKIVGGVAVLPKLTARSLSKDDDLKDSKESPVIYDYEPGRRTFGDQTSRPYKTMDEKQTNGYDKEPLTSTPTIYNKSISSTQTSSGFHLKPLDNMYMKEYSYTVEERNERNSQFSPKHLGGFNYTDKQDGETPLSSPLQDPLGRQHPGYKRATATAFTYKPPETTKESSTASLTRPVSAFRSAMNSNTAQSPKMKESTSAYSWSTNKEKEDRVRMEKTEERQFAQLINTKDVKETKKEKSASTDKMNYLFGKSTKKSSTPSTTTSTSQTSTSKLFSSFLKSSDEKTIEKKKQLSQSASNVLEQKKTSSTSSLINKYNNLTSSPKVIGGSSQEPVKQTKLDSDSESSTSSENSMDEYASEELKTDPTTGLVSTNSYLTKSTPTFTSTSSTLPRTTNNMVSRTAQRYEPQPTSTDSKTGYSKEKTSTPQMEKKPATTITTSTKVNATGKSPFTTIDDTTKTASSSNSYSTIKHTTGEETLDDPKRGPVKYKKESVLQEEKKVSQQVTESHKIITGRLEDVMPILQKEAERYGHPTGQELKLPTKSSPVISSETRKQTYTTTSGSSNNQVPMNTKLNKDNQNLVSKPLTKPTQFVNDNSPGMSPTSSPAEQMMSSKTRTVETVTYKVEKDGVVETRVEQKITIQSDGEPVDYDRAVQDAISEATKVDPKMHLEKIEISQQSSIN